MQHILNSIWQKACKENEVQHFISRTEQRPNIKRAYHNKECPMTSNGHHDDDAAKELAQYQDVVNSKTI